MHFESSRLVGFCFSGKRGFSKFRFAFCSPLVTAEALFVTVNSLVGGIIASLCTNYVLVGTIQNCLTSGFCLGHCNVSLLVILPVMPVGQ